MHKGFLLLLRSTAHLCAISALYAVPPKKERLPAVFLCFDQWSVKNMFLFLCRFEDALYSPGIQFHEKMSFLCFSEKQMKNFHLFIRVFCAQNKPSAVFPVRMQSTKNPCRGPWFRQGKQLLFFTQTAPPHRSRRRTG